MKKTDCVYIGRILKPHGIKGEFGVKLEISALRHFKKIKILLVSIYNDEELVPFFIESAETDDKGNGRIKFDDCNSIESIRDLVNKEIFVPAKFFPKSFSQKISADDIVGFSVIDKKFGAIGFVERIYENSEQKTLQIKNGEKEILIPYVDEIILKTDKKNNTLHTSIPDGLMEIYF